MVFGAMALLQALEVLAVGLAVDIARLKSLERRTLRTRRKVNLLGLKKIRALNSC